MGEVILFPIDSASLTAEAKTTLTFETKKNNFKSGSGEGGMRDIDKRVTVLEVKTSTIESTLDRIERKLESMDQKFENKLDAMDQKFERKLDVMDSKINSNFTWTVTTILATAALLCTILGGLQLWMLNTVHHNSIILTEAATKLNISP